MMGNNKSVLLDLHDNKQSESIIINVGAANSTSSLPAGLTSFSTSPLSATNSAGFLRRFRNHANNDLFRNRLKSKKNINSIERLNCDDLLIKDSDRKKKKLLASPKCKFSIKNKLNEDKINKTTSTTSITIKHQIKLSINPNKSNEIIIEPEYTSINDSNLMEVDYKLKQNQIEESFYESALEMYEFITNQKELSKKISKNNMRPEFKNANHLDSNLYSEISRTSSTSSPASILIIPNGIQFKKCNLQPLSNFFHRFKNFKKNRNKKLEPQLPQLPAKAFNPAKEFIYEQAKLVNKDNESNIYFKIGKLSEEEEDYDDEKRLLKIQVPPLPPKPLKLKLNENYQILPEYEAIKQSQSPLSSESSSSTSPSDQSFNDNSQQQQLPPLPPLPDKLLAHTSIEPVNFNNQVYYSFISDKKNDSIENEYYSLNLTNIEGLINRVNLSNQIICNVDYCKSTSLIRESTTDNDDLDPKLNSQSFSNIDSKTEAFSSDSNQINISTNTINSNMTNSSPKISSCTSLSTNSNASCNNQDEASVIKL